VEHVHPLDRPFPWRAAALAAGTLALAELTALLALAGVRLFDAHHAAAAARPPAAAVVTRHRPTRHAVPLRPRSRLSVLVLNGNGVSGAAGTEAARLVASGYRHAVPTDAPQDYASSLVLFRPGLAREARRLAGDAKIRTVAPLDGRLQGTDARYPLVVVLGAN
jgi:LytR cell envelope-related transcriptional attenuator